jgi:ectoine hydroxylase-related dioxygenase (phytanoyl-CoA dioxygenase family)
MSLNAAEQGRFERDGWVGPYPLLDAAEVARACELRGRVIPRITQPNRLAQATGPQAFEDRPWFKSMHAVVPEYYDAACHPAIVRRVASVLGPDVIAWGLTLTRSVPGGTHRWHLDIEHLRWPGVSVYIGLVNNDQDSTLKVLRGSHRMPERPQVYGVEDDASALAAVRPTVPGAEIVRTPIGPGEFLLFDGRLWHASHNTGPNTRIAMIIHYSRPDARVQIPLNFDEPVRWHESRPPCVLVCGEDRPGINRLVGRPQPLPPA